MTYKEQFRIWMIKEFGRQDADDYAGTFTEEIAIRYAESKDREIAELKRIWDKCYELTKETTLAIGLKAIAPKPPYQP